MYLCIYVSMYFVLRTYQADGVEIAAGEYICKYGKYASMGSSGR